MTVLLAAGTTLIIYALYSEIAEYREALRRHTALVDELARRARRE